MWTTSRGSLACAIRTSLATEADRIVPMPDGPTLPLSPPSGRRPSHQCQVETRRERVPPRLPWWGWPPWYMCRRERPATPQPNSFQETDREGSGSHAQPYGVSVRYALTVRAAIAAMNTRLSHHENGIQTWTPSIASVRTTNRHAEAILFR